MEQKGLDSELLPSVYEIQRHWTGLSWETCERLQGYITHILAKAEPIIRKEEREKIIPEIQKMIDSAIKSHENVYHLP